MNKKSGLSKKGIPERHREEFEKLYQEATQMYASIGVLQGVFRTVRDGDPTLIKALSGNTIWMSRGEPPDPQGAWAHSLLHALSVLKPLCAELYLKALVHTERKTPPKTHDLDELYRMLEYTNRQDLKRCLPNSIDLAMKDIVSDDESEKFVRENDIGKILALHRGDFLGVRYGQESSDQRRVRLTDLQVNLTGALHALSVVCTRRDQSSATEPFLEDKFE